MIPNHKYTESAPKSNLKSQSTSKSYYYSSYLARRLIDNIKVNYFFSIAKLFLHYNFSYVYCNIYIHQLK